MKSTHTTFAVLLLAMPSQAVPVDDVAASKKKDYSLTALDDTASLQAVHQPSSTKPQELIVAAKAGACVNFKKFHNQHFCVHGYKKAAAHDVKTQAACENKCRDDDKCNAIAFAARALGSHARCFTYEGCDESNKDRENGYQFFHKTTVACSEPPSTTPSGEGEGNTEEGEGEGNTEIDEKFIDTCCEARRSRRWRMANCGFNQAGTTSGNPKVICQMLFPPNSETTRAKDATYANCEKKLECTPKDKKMAWEYDGKGNFNDQDTCWKFCKL